MNNMLAFTIKRLLAMVAVLWIIATIVFILSHLSGLDPVYTIEPKPTPYTYHHLQHTLGLDKPLIAQYADFMVKLLHGNLGVSWQPGYLFQPVWSLLRNDLPVSLKLGSLSLLAALLMALPVGIVSALKQNSWIDHGLQIIVMVMYALPSFVVAPFAQILFGVYLRWLPVAGWGDPGVLGYKEMILPIAVFSTQIAGYFAKSFRSFMLEVLSQDYIRTARAKGLKERVVIYLHAFKNTLLPLGSIVGPTIAHLVHGAFIIEVYFAIPGIGAATVNSVIAGDYPTVEATTILIASSIVVVNALTDIFYAMVDPRVRI